MIRLTHLRVTNFKQLRDVELKFPGRFCTLVEGLNEAGKSTLLESIYFGLYGKGLATAGGLSSLISHGHQSAEVTLGVAVHDVKLNITRKLRTSGPSTAKVEIARPDKTEAVTGVTKVNKEVLTYLNNLDGESLLASCFVQQKKLGGLEDLGVSERQKILLRLLDMDRLTSMGGAFKWGIAERQKLETARKKFRLAEATCQKIEAETELEEVQRLCTIAQIHAVLEEADTYDEKARAAREAAASHKAEISRIQDVISRLEALDTAIHILDRTLRAREVIAGREQDLAKVINNLSHIDHLKDVTLPALQSELAALNQLREQIERIASLEQKNKEVNRRIERLQEAITRGDHLAPLKTEVGELQEQLESASGERDKLSRAYDAARLAETLRSTITQTNLEIDQAEKRKQRLARAIEDLESLGQKREQAAALAGMLAALNRQAQALQARVEAATGVQNKRSEIDQLEKAVAASEAREATLNQISEQAKKLDARKQEVTAIEHQLAWVSTERQQIEQRYLRAQQANALLRWAAAKRDADIRSKQAQINTELHARAEEARRRQRQARSRGQSAGRMLLTAWGLAGAGAIALLTGVFTLWALIPAGCILVVTGLALGVVSQKRRRQAAIDQIAAEEEASQFEREVIAGEANLRARQNQSPLDIEEAKRHLRALGLAEPARANDAEVGAKGLAGESLAELSAQLDGKRQEMSRIEVDLKGKQGALEAEAQVLARELNKAGIHAVSEIAQAIHSERTRQQQARQSQMRARADIEQLEAALPAGWNIEGLASDLEDCKREYTRIDLEIAQANGIIEAEQRQIRDVFDAEKVSDRQTATEVIKEIEGLIAKMARKNSSARAELAEAESAIPANLSPADLYRQLGKATTEVNRMGAEIKGRQARIEAEEESVAEILSGEQVADLHEARAAVGRLEAAAIEMSRRIAGIWQAERPALERWNLPAETAGALSSITGERARIATEIKRTGDQIGQRAAIESERDRIVKEIDSQSRNIEGWHKEITEPLRKAQLDADPHNITIRTESELLNQIRAERERYDLAELRAEQQDALQAQATAESIAAQAENKSLESRRTAEALLRGLGPTGIQEVTAAKISERLPEFNQVTSADTGTLRERSEAIGKRIYALDQEAIQLEGELFVKRDQLVFEECQQALNNLVKRQVVCDRATLILGRVQENILKAVLPSTLDYMCRLLPPLTNGRYHEAQLDEESYKIRVHDRRAGDFIEKDVFSGATQDQFSLALRLAFALATLPEGLGARPKFIFLDEPTAGFDGERRKAFVELLTRGEVSEQFDQIFLLTPMGIFETNPLPHYIRIANGRVVGESLSSANV